MENLIGVDIEREPFAIAYYVYQYGVEFSTVLDDLWPARRGEVT